MANDFIATDGNPGTIHVTSDQGGTFDFISCQFCNANVFISGQAVTFTGTKPGGAVVSENFFTPNRSTAIQTFAPDGFTGLERLEISVGGVGFANFVFTPHGSKTVTFKENFPAGCPSESAIYREAGLGFKNNKENKWCSPMVNGFIMTATSPSRVLVVPEGGGTFDVKTIQACSRTEELSGQDLTFTGTKAGGGTVTESFATPDHSTKPWTFASVGLTNLTSVDIALGQTAISNLVFIPHPK